MGITEQNDIDLWLLYENFVEADDYPKEVSMTELQYHQTQPDFLVLVHGDIDGFLIAYRKVNCLWIHQVWHRNESDLKPGREAFELAKKWAKERGMTSIMGETRRDEFRALKRYGFEEHAVVIKCEI